MTNYYVASDHAAIEMKKFVVEYLHEKGFHVVDLGPNTPDRVDYPDFAKKLADNITLDGDAKGILICGSGIGMSIAANKCKGIRAGLARDAYDAKMAREHNDANVLCLGERTTGLGTAESILDAWCKSDFEGGRHAQRVEKITKLEE
jgi:ribose 5-phosphate isomerase B